MVPQSLACSPNFTQFTQRPPVRAARPNTAEAADGRNRTLSKQAHYFSNPAREEQGDVLEDRPSFHPLTLALQPTPYAPKEQLQKKASPFRYYLEVNKKNHRTYFVLHA
ncbi:hypothetical protein HPB48_017664 [Haemaphysalis longicornis]|uniref:Uncharacterized protein n=1 Tax=Haemaphysalis longicornis TaxID=44386 RepID=A0A9J6GNA1_HAELO|nr:hypothetical protein HPB48_017664 [Haemaphysalis longicornis]